MLPNGGLKIFLCRKTYPRQTPRENRASYVNYLEKIVLLRKRRLKFPTLMFKSDNITNSSFWVGQSLLKHFTFDNKIKSNCKFS